MELKSQTAICVINCWSFKYLNLMKETKLKLSVSSTREIEIGESHLGTVPKEL